MATFDPYSDSPFKIKHEGQEIVVTQNRLSPTTIRISWTLPNSVSCQIPAAYNGAIVTLDNTPTALDKLPVDGNIYKSDPTADASLFAGDKISTARVVGTFYNDITTTYVDVNEASDAEAFYVSVHAVDAQYRYHTDGAHSYSLPFGKKEDLPEAAYQVIKLGATGSSLDALTGLNTNTTYSFKIHVDSITPDPIVTFLGANALTYGNMINAMNLNIIMQQNPVVADSTPNVGAYWVDVPKRLVYKHNGTKYVAQAPVLAQPVDPFAPAVGTTWFKTDTKEMFLWNGAAWMIQSMSVQDRDPRNPYCNDYWYNPTTPAMYKWNGGAWLTQVLFESMTDPQLPPAMSCGKYWFHDGLLYNWYESTCLWVAVPFALAPPTIPVSGDVYVDAAIPQAYVWDDVDDVWVAMQTFSGTIDPSLAVVRPQGSIWYDTIVGTFYRLDGTSWVVIHPITSLVKPQVMADGSYWLNTRDGFFYKLAMGMWVRFTPANSINPPNALDEGAYWFDTSTLVLNQLANNAWVQVPYETAPRTQAVGSYWYNDVTGELFQWNGVNWNPAKPIAEWSMNVDGNLVLTSATTGSTSNAFISSAGNIWTPGNLSPTPWLQLPVKGMDPVSGVPSYMQVGVGTDGSQDERRQMIDRIKGTLGFPAVEVELTKAQMDTAIDMALEKLRSVSSSAYKRGYFAMDLMPRVQHYKLTDATVGFNKVVDVFYVYRAQATFIGSAQGNSVYGQMAVQQLFNMGKFDLLSYHMVSSYIKTMQQLFAAEIMFTWDEHTRELALYKDFTEYEKVLVDASLERTEQELLTDRWTRGWLQKFATAQCRYMLAGIRGKFSTLPGAGGGISLNASDLTQRADQEIIECMDDVDNFVVNDKVNVGLGADFVLG